jgi:hypothetical protein
VESGRRRDAESTHEARFIERGIDLCGLHFARPRVQRLLIISPCSRVCSRRIAATSCNVFTLANWYLDLVTEEGAAVIGYSARLDAGRVRAAY